MGFSKLFGEQNILFFIKSYFKKSLFQHERWFALPFSHVDFDDRRRQRRLLPWLGATMPIYRVSYAAQYTAASTYYAQRYNYLMRSKGYLDFRQQLKSENEMGDYHTMNADSFVHSLQLVNNPAKMDDFQLDELETVMSEFHADERGLSLIQSEIISETESNDTMRFMMASASF